MRHYFHQGLKERMWCVLILWTAQGMFSGYQLLSGDGNLGRALGDATWRLLCVACPDHQTRGRKHSDRLTSRSPPYCCPSSITTMTSFCCHASSVEKGLALSPAHEPPVISRRRRSWTLCFLEEWKISKYVPESDVFASESATKRPM